MSNIKSIGLVIKYESVSTGIDFDNGKFSVLTDIPDILTTGPYVLLNIDFETGQLRDWDNKKQLLESWVKDNNEKKNPPKQTQHSVQPQTRGEPPRNNDKDVQK